MSPCHPLRLSLLSPATQTSTSASGRSLPSEALSIFWSNRPYPSQHLDLYSRHHLLPLGQTPGQRAPTHTHFLLSFTQSSKRPLVTQSWKHTPVIPAPGLKQENCYKLKVSQGYIMNFRSEMATVKLSQDRQMFLVSCPTPGGRPRARAKIKNNM